ncbi:MAG: peptidase [Flavobacteriaceae bacterium]|nr:peptidase [Flavobacteriaceae bacterium]|tara:strand:+ start:8160 stop:10586 length:2427 start_codon:yes stop_codon:yes gene_type:complete
MNKRIFILLLVPFISFQIMAQRNKKKNLNTSKVQLMPSYKGYFNFYYDKNEDKIFLEVDKVNEEFLYVNSLSQGIGSNDIGLDRGQLGNRRVVYFKKAGNKLLLVEPNQKYRANSNNYLERKSITQAFAKSIIWSFSIQEVNEGKYLIDLTDFLFNDSHGVSQRLKSRRQGIYKVDKSRSSIELDRTKAFPKNIEFDAELTFVGQPQGDLIRSVTPSPDAITVNQHHSFIKLPPLNFKMRRFDPRSGANAFRYYDYTTPVNESTLQEFVVRHRLEKKNPELEISEAVEPIIYYLDNGTPEPVRSALIEGGSWWNQAFESIGFKNAFQVKILPDFADPLDVRYNVIQWIHRSTRGWSYGASVVDPRTGEILKGHVSLGSLRIRQDFMIALGLTESPFKLGSTNHNNALSMALARIRQLSAHEIGHTLGFAHNFAASSKDRSSVMDYPHPTLKLVDGKIQYNDAYSIGIGEWDKVSVAYSYSHFPDSVDEELALMEILNKSHNNGFRFISDSDSRPISGAHPKAHLWDNGENATNELKNLMKIRKVALNNFSLDHLRIGENYSKLEDRLVPMYFLHRYQLEAVVKIIGGINYNYGVKSKIMYVTSPVNIKDQYNALEALLNAMSPSELTIPKSLHSILSPRVFGSYRNRESFGSQTGVAFDYLGIANSLSDAIVSMILNPQRSSRLIQQSAMSDNQLTFEIVLSKLIDQNFKIKQSNKYHTAIQEMNQSNILKHMFKLGKDPNVYPQVRSEIFDKLNDLSRWLNNNRQLKYSDYYSNQIKQFNLQPEILIPNKPERIPDGSPIGLIACDL